MCEICKNIDDESHFFLTCTINAVPRKTLMEKFKYSDQKFEELTEKEKLIKLLNPSTPDEIKAVASFIEKSLELREGDPKQS